jgi:hypothetical protein
MFASLKSMKKVVGSGVGSGSGSKMSPIPNTASNPVQISLAEIKFGDSVLITSEVLQDIFIAISKTRGEGRDTGTMKESLL